MEFEKNVERKLSLSAQAILAVHLASSAMGKRHLMQRRLQRNRHFFAELILEGYDYLLKPRSGELHQLSWPAFFHSCHLRTANLFNFYPIRNLGVIAIHLEREGTLIPLLDEESRKCIGYYELNLCQHCLGTSRRIPGYSALASGFLN